MAELEENVLGGYVDAFQRVLAGEPSGRVAFMRATLT